MSISRYSFVCSIILLCTFATAALAADQGSLRVGAIRVDITPASDAALPMSGYAGRTEGFKAIHDPLHLRTIVVDDGANQAALVSCEVIGFSNALWDDITRNLAAATGIPREGILLAAVHTHAAPSLGTYEGKLTEKQVAYVEKLKKAIVDSVLDAKRNLRPAKVGFGTGHANVNMNRRARDDQGGWMLGNNPEGVSDKTVAVIRFDSLAGEPIAIITNYGVHGTVLGQGNLQISSDLPGATARFVEQHFGDKIVAPWTSGTSGDQDPIYRTGTDFRNVAALGRILGEEVIQVADSIKTSPRARVRAMQSVVTCPGKRTVQAPGPGRQYKWEDADPVSIRLSLLVINDIAITGVSGEVLTNIGLRLKKESPFTRTIMVTHCNGSSGYLPDDAAYEQVSYEITTTRVKPGCAENAIIDGFLKMLATFF
jgi:Neutral/alkaline non-lysosomal ceramidase, N-terminal